jgi:hypothetical protein
MTDIDVNRGLDSNYSHFLRQLKSYYENYKKQSTAGDFFAARKKANLMEIASCLQPFNYQNFINEITKAVKSILLDKKFLFLQLSYFSQPYF